jgi:spore germination protein KC
MRWKRKAAALLESALIALSFSGCFSYHELENMTIVTAVAVDEGQNGKLYHLSFECLNMSSGGEEGQQGTQPVILESEGNSIFDGVRNALTEASQKLYFSDCQEVILSRKIAQKGIRKVLNWFLSDAETRVTLRFVVSEEPTAAELLNQKQKTAQTPAFEISGALEEAYADSLACLPLKLYEINNILSEEGDSLTLPGVRVEEKPGKPAWLRLGRTAVFRDDRLIGWLPENQVPYFLFVRNRVQNGLIVPGSRMPGAAFEIAESKTDLDFSFSGSAPFAEVRIKSQVTADELATGQKNGDLSSPNFNELEKSARNTVEAGVESVVEYVQKTSGVDIFGFGYKISKEYPSEWKKLSKNWDGTFRRMKCRADAEIKVRNTSKLVERDAAQ